jgi:hypothetical protein
MAICNLFKKLTKQTGEFLMFSQWAEDLTQNHAKGYKYRAVPSKFIAANIDFKELLQSGYSESNDLNISLPTYLQKYFENGCAVGKNNLDWNPEYSSNLFWEIMCKAGLINIDSSDVVNEFKYIGDINIQSYDEKNGMGYNEIYCYIPNDSKEMKIKCTKQSDSRYILNDNDMIEGYDISANLALNGSGVSGISYEFGNRYLFENDSDNSFETEKYDLNCIIILYNIKSWDESGTSNDLYTNIPLGIYLPGCFKDNEITNHVTKWISNSNIYNSGTSYGIRICTRFSVIPNSDNILTTDIEPVNSEEFASISKIMSGISDNLECMKSITTQSIFTSDNLKETLNMFQNSKTNVPYILDVNGVKYWFVNGKNTGVSINENSSDNYEECSDEEVYNLLEQLSLDGIVTEAKLYPYNEKTKSVMYYPKTYYGEIQDPVNVTLKWEFINKYSKEPIEPQYVSCEVNDENIDITTSTFTVNNIDTDCKCRLNIKHNDKIIPHDFDFKFYYQSYFGFVDGSIIDKYDEDNNINHIINQQNIYKYTLPSAYNRFKFKSTGDYIVYIYPKAYGKLEKILSVNNHDDILDDFDFKEITISMKKKDGTDAEIEYYFYHTHNYSGAGEIVLDFTNTNNIIDTCQVI